MHAWITHDDGDVVAPESELEMLEKADAFFDALESGADVLNDHVDPVELVERLKLQRP